MHIVYLASSVIPSKAANSIQVMKMCNAFAEHGHEVDLVVPERLQKEMDVDDPFSFYDIDPTFEITKVPRPGLSSLGTFISNYLMAREATRLDPDVVYGRSVIACSLASTRGLRTVFEAHTPVTQGRFGSVKQFFFRRLLDQAQTSHLVTISDALKDHFEKEYPDFDGNVFVARDGADAVDESVQSIDLDGSDERLQVGYIGHLYQGRGVELIEELANRHSDADFHIIGGDDATVDYWREKTLNLDNISFHGFLPPNELDKYRLAFDVLLAPYQLDLETRSGYNTLQWMSPLKIFEYMAAGRPIVASDLPAIREILNHEETALLCEPGNPEDWSKAIQQLKHDPEMRWQLGENSKKEFLTEYTWRVRAQKILDSIEVSAS